MSNPPDSSGFNQTASRKPGGFFVPKRAKTCGSQSGPKGTIIAVSLPNGSTVAVASAYAAAKAFTSISNAAEAVVNDATHTYAIGDILEITSGWSKLNGRLARVKSVVASTSYTLEKIDTSNLTKYPAGSGIGSTRKITTWQQITQILSSASSGGEQGFAPYSFLEDSTERRIPTKKSARGYTFSVADDPNLAHYPVLQAADEDTISRGIRLSLANGGSIFMNAFVTMSDSPSLTQDELMAVEVTISLSAPTTRYVN